MDEIVALAQAILSKTALTEAQAKLYAAVHVVMNGVAFGARSVDAALVDLLDERVDNEPYVAVATTAPQSPVDELAAMRKAFAELQAQVAAMTKPAAAVNTAGGSQGGSGKGGSGSQRDFVHGGGN